ncbi:NUDIX hydrolase [Psychrobacillus sp. FSL W7-1493]|uniref:NUDIX hydrolase n=1 Tax=Psychrobacillus sp. FSL W7-1493 TaxID=2921552 RepID=UPI0030FA098B
MLREVKEETGYTTEREPVLLGQFYVNPATQTNKVYTYLILDAFQISDQHLDPTEFVDVHIFDFKEMHSLIKNGEIQQLFTANAYYMALDFLKENAIK